MAASSSGEGTGVRVLLVEDEAAIRRATTSALEALGHSVDAAVDIEAAQSMLEEHTYDLALLDLNLRQGAGGFVLVRYMRSQGIATPVVIISSTRDHEDILACFRLGVADFVQKPVRVSELHCVTGRVLKRGAVAANKAEASDSSGAEGAA